MFERAVIVRTDEYGITAAYPNGETRAIAWAEIDCVAIETNDSGPWGPDLWWLFEGKGKGSQLSARRHWRDRGPEAAS